ncbi:MAG: DoxX family protein [Streptosporangiales bacterium]|nr:DoxX family protein [Streptosporangiales bacterium]
MTIAPIIGRIQQTAVTGTADFVLANARSLGLSPTFVTLTGIPKAVAAVGLGIGLAGAGTIGLLAAIGLVVFFACALTLHVYRRAFGKIAAPLVFGLRALGALAYFA